jgi:hypothetical protein
VVLEKVGPISLWYIDRRRDGYTAIVQGPFVAFHGIVSPSDVAYNLINQDEYQYFE